MATSEPIPGRKQAAAARDQNPERVTADEAAGVDWWNAQDTKARRFWLEQAQRAGLGLSVAGAWSASKRCRGRKTATPWLRELSRLSPADLRRISRLVDLPSSVDRAKTDAAHLMLAAGPEPETYDDPASASNPSSPTWKIRARLTLLERPAFGPMRSFLGTGGREPGEGAAASTAVWWLPPDSDNIPNW